MFVKENLWRILSQHEHFESPQTDRVSQAIREVRIFEASSFSHQSFEAVHTRMKDRIMSLPLRSF
jgi:hypothetical protein